MLYVITDTHLGHKGMINSCGRPENFSNIILKNWKEMVTKKDTVIHLGDIAWTEEDLKRLLKLPGRKILVRGNHDKKTNEEYMELGFNFSCDELMMKLAGMHVLFSHHPHYGHTADINIHGHQHDLHRDDYSRLYLPLALEAMGYKPLAIDRDFLQVLHNWVDNRHIPDIKEIMALRQNYYDHPLAKDLYGWEGRMTKEDWEKRVRRNGEFDTFLASQKACHHKAEIVGTLRKKYLLGYFDDLAAEWNNYTGGVAKEVNGKGVFI